MKISMEQLHKDIVNVKNDVVLIKNILIEEGEFELSDWAKKELAEARKIPDSKLIDHEEIERRILGK